MVHRQPLPRPVRAPAKEDLHHEADRDPVRRNRGGRQGARHLSGPGRGSSRFQKCADEWLRTKPLEASSREIIERRLRVHAYPVLGWMSLHQITPSVIRGWLNELELSSSNSRRSVFTNLATVLTAAGDDALIPKNPCRAGSVRPPALERRRIRPWDTTMVSAVRGTSRDTSWP